MSMVLHFEHDFLVFAFANNRMVSLSFSLSKFSFQILKFSIVFLTSYISIKKSLIANLFYKLHMTVHLYKGHAHWTRYRSTSSDRSLA